MIVRILQPNDWAASETNNIQTVLGYVVCFPGVVIVERNLPDGDSIIVLSRVKMDTSLAEGARGLS